MSVPQAVAVMEDDSVLCADCAHEATGDSGSEGAETIVHAWIDAAPGVRCCWCGEAEQLDDAGRWSP
jgi:hypothetical protein